MTTTLQTSTFVRTQGCASRVGRLPYHQSTAKGCDHDNDDDDEEEEEEEMSEADEDEEVGGGVDALDKNHTTYEYMYRRAERSAAAQKNYILVTRNNERKDHLQKCFLEFLERRPRRGGGRDDRYIYILQV